MKTFLVIAVLWAGPAFSQSAPESKSIIELVRNIDLSCLKFEIVGPCAQPLPGVYIRYWEPTLLMETVHAPGDYVVREIGFALKPLMEKIANVEMGLINRSDIPVTSTNGWQSVSGSNLHFNEVHLYDFPLKLIEQTVLCPSVPNQTLGIRYLSELDSIFWRRGLFEQNLPQTQAAARSPAFHIGVWGPLYPRTGFVIAVSSAVSSAIDALRAVSIAGFPLGHIVESPLDFQMNMSVDKMQMLHPEKSMCMSPGTDPRVWEPGRVSKDGNYVWLYWRYRECCKTIVPAQ